MKKIFYSLLFAICAFTVYPQKMVVQKTDGTNIFLDMNTIETINFIIPCPGTPTVDYEGKTYNTVLIGEQCWLKENLDVGTQIVHGQYPGNNSIIEKYCYNNLPANCETYGGLYFWDEAMQYVTTTGARGICPLGWHMPTMAEYQSLANYLDNNSNAMKQEGQGSGDGQGTNTSGFSALLAGAKGYSGGPFQGLGESTNYWMGEKGVSYYACNVQILKTTSTIHLYNNGIKSWALSVRCIKD